MKTKNFIAATLCLLLSVFAAQAQFELPDPLPDQSLLRLPFYEETRILQWNDITYQCDNNGWRVTLYNAQGKFTYVDKTYKDGSEYLEESEHVGGELFSAGPEEVKENFWIYAKPIIDSIVNDIFYPVRFQLKDRTIVITLIIDTETGKVSEVIYEFPNASPYTLMPVFMYHKLELALKDNLRFTLTDHGKRLNYAMLTWGFGIELRR
jgi:hypothetical protein